VLRTGNFNQAKNQIPSNPIKSCTIKINLIQPIGFIAWNLEFASIGVSGAEHWHGKGAFSLR